MAICRVVAAAMHPMKDVQSLVVDAQQLRRDKQRFAGLGLSEMRDVILDGVIHAAGVAVGLVDADPAEQRIHRVAE